MLCAAENLTLSEKDKDKQNYLVEKHFTHKQPRKRAVPYPSRLLCIYCCCLYNIRLSTCTST